LAPHFPDLEILALIGTGGMGAVYKARQPNLDRFVALKVLSCDLVGDPAFAERFGREARVLAKLSHPNIVAVYDSGTKGPYSYLIMEYVDGVNLRQAMRTGGFSPAEALTLVEDVCSALKFAHEKGILHRDIKPENVLIDSDGQVKIADFGIAKIVAIEERHDVTLTFTGSILGSPYYMAPEQIESPGDVDQRADIYSLGVVLYEMLTGELPLGRFALPSRKVRLDARIDEIVLRTLEKEREARFQSADEVKTRVEAVRIHPGAPSRSRGTSSSRRGKARSAAFWVVSVGVSIVIGVVAVYTFALALRIFSEAEPADPDQPAALEEPGRAEQPTPERAVTNPPTIDLALTVAPGLMASLRFVNTDAVGEERALHTHRRYILASDRDAWRGEVQFATVTYPDRPSPSAGDWISMSSSIRSDSHSVAYLDGSRIARYDPAWTWEEEGTIVLDLTSPGRHEFKVAARSDLSEVLSLRVEARPRSVPGVPAASLGHVELEKAVCGQGGDIEWIRYLMEKLEKPPPTLSEPEPEWRSGRPEKHCNLTVPAGMVATFGLKDTDGEIYQRGYIVASDLEPWVGKLRIGSLVGRAEMQLRLEGPSNTVTANIERPDTWVLEPDVYSQTLDNTRTTYVTFLGEVRSDNASPSEKKPRNGRLTLDLKVERRKYKAERLGLPEVLALHYMGLGEAPDWIEDVKQAIETTAQP